MFRRLRLVALVLPVLWAGDACAEEWHEAYRGALRALAQGQSSRAVSLLEQAVSQRPEPGRNVITYGTNVIERYYPYLHLAEAYLQWGDVAGARSALKRSETWGKEPADERRRLAVQVEELAARLSSPTPAATTHPPPATPPPATIVEPRAETTVAATPVPPPVPLPVPSSPAVVVTPAPPDRERVAARGLPVPRTTFPSVPPVRNEEPIGAGLLEVVSQPPGANVYLDDELIGTTDPEWGRLVKTGVSPGRHRIRLTLAGHQDVIDDVDLSAGGRADFRRRLSPASPGLDRRYVLFAVVAAILLAMTAWALRRPGGAVSVGTSPLATPATPPTPPTPRRVPAFDGPGGTPPRGTPPRSTPPRSTPPRSTPSAMGSPGVHRDAQGLEYFGEYRLLEPLGRGGMASVYKALRRGEVCALKRPLAAFLEEPEFLERFLREAEIGRTLHHPNIVRILERGEVEGVPFFTMELVPGETLQALLQRSGALEPRLATGIVAQIAEALDYAHLKGVVHRDLKPSNVMILADGTAKVMDYGIARARRFEGLTVTGSFLGSPEYVAPEAIEGGTTDARSDLYSVGVVFYELLAGRRPFIADTPFAILRMHLSDAPPPLAQLRPGLPAELEGIVMRLLSKSVDERYAGAEDLVLALRDFLNRAA